MSDTAALTPDAISAQLDAQRQQLAADVDALTARLSPAAMTVQARKNLDSVVSRASALVGADREPGAPASSLSERVSTLLGDASDGDPASLTIVTVAAAGLGALALVATARAIRSLLR